MQAALTRRSSRDLHAGVDAAGAPSRRARHLPNAVIHHFNCTIAMNVVLLDAASVALDNITSIAAHRRRRRSMRRTGGLHRGIGAPHAPRLAGERCAAPASPTLADSHGLPLTR
jgi:hypothetical protein